MDLFHLLLHFFHSFLHLIRFRSRSLVARRGSGLALVSAGMVSGMIVFVCRPHQGYGKQERQ